MISEKGVYVICGFYNCFIRNYPLEGNLKEFSQHPRVLDYDAFVENGMKIVFNIL